MKTRLIPILTLAAATSPAITAFANLERKDSKEFAYKYEMNALPTAEDLDNSGAADFTGNGTWTTLSNGAMIMNMSGGGKYLNSDAASGTAGDAWLSLDATSATGGTGYTIETLLKIDSQSDKYAFNLQASTGDTSTYNAFLNFKTNAIYWGETLLTNLDATAWHTYRVVREGGGEEKKFSVYVDGSLVRDGLGNGLSATINRIIIGSPGASYKGKATMAYLRFDKGAYAPPAAITGKAARKWSGEFPVQYEMNAGDSRFVGATAGGTDWSGAVDSGVTVTQNGVLSVGLPTAKLAYWKVNDDVWRAGVGADTAYTLEFKIKITNKNTPSGDYSNWDRVVQFICGNPRDASVFCIGANSVIWEPAGSNSNVKIAEGDNTDDWHVFRLTYSGASQNGNSYVYTLWRDGEVIGTNLNGSVAYNQYSSAGFPNLLRWGVTSTLFGGSFDVDYIRWDTTGAYDWKNPRKGMMVVIR